MFIVLLRSLSCAYWCFPSMQHVGWWSPTIIRGEDREAVHIPNHKFTVNVVRNLTQKTHWRIKTHLAISHLDVNKINVRNSFVVYVELAFHQYWVFYDIFFMTNGLMLLQNIVADMRKVLAKNPQVEQQRLHRRVFLDNINPENQALMVCMKWLDYYCLLQINDYVLIDRNLKSDLHMKYNILFLWFSQILVSCFVKTSHFEEYLCVKVIRRLAYLYKNLFLLVGLTWSSTYDPNSGPQFILLKD